MDEFGGTIWVANEVANCSRVWLECAARPATLEPRYCPGDHASREAAYDHAMHEVEWEAKRLARYPHHRAAAERRMVAAFARFAQSALDLDREQIGLITNGFLPAGIEFARRARAFDPAISRDDTLQACRNAWTVCGLQALLGAPFQITPSVLAYSLLYPYSDNYLDCANETAAVKRILSERFRMRLLGSTAPPANPREKAIWSLVAMIERDLPRARFPEVYSCLLGTHKAQEDSLRQLGNSSCLDDQELLRVSFAKGGTSVLVDACLVRGFTTPQESRAAFEWGALLQLGDDLQDAADDLARGSQTAVTKTIRRGEPLDAFVLRLLAFCDCVSAHMSQLPGASRCLGDLLKLSWRSLILGAVADASEFFTPEFQQLAERSSPFRFEFLRARRRSLAGRQGLYATTFDQLVKQAPASERISPSLRSDSSTASAAWRSKPKMACRP